MGKSNSEKKVQMISFIMMAYNVEHYIEDAILELQKENTISWELIIVNDFSTDNTFQKAKYFADKDNRIRLVNNITKGKVTGTNYGYSLTKGNIIKCIDSDDVLLKDFFKDYKNILNYDAHCHNAFITDNKLNIQSVYNINPRFISKDYEFVLSNLISFPKWSWSFKREIAEKIFPMPETLPFEDVWIGLAIKKYSKDIYTINKPLYLYRQHKNQTFGGIINYDSEKVIFRSKRLLRLMEVIKNEYRLIEGFDINIFDSAKTFNMLMSMKKINILTILKSKLNLSVKIKIILIKKLPNIAKFATLLKWRLDAFYKS
jgi:glycosyltransferase involved in cell wall biosynthesis